MNAALLNVLSVYFNPMRWTSRLKLTREFEQRMLDDGVKLTMVECQLGERPWELNTPGVDYFRVRNHTILWNKENLQNLGVAHIAQVYPDFRYLMWCDADVLFENGNWAVDTVHKLQQYKVIQPWSDCYDMGPQLEHRGHARSFCYQWWHGFPVEDRGYHQAHPGYAWAWQRSALEGCGGFIETGALGAGDRHMALGLIGKVNESIAKGISPGYMAPLYTWQRNAQHHVNQNIGFLLGTIRHFWHGKKANRRYWDRWKIIVRNHFDPATDLKRNMWGVFELAGNKPRMQHELDRYFRMRTEDGNDPGDLI